MEFENGNDITCLEYGVYDDDQFCCGDSVCNTEANESCDTCSGDCETCCPAITCPNGMCEVGETCASCAADCEASCGGSSQCEDNGECGTDEAKECEDCRVTNVSCEDDTDCPWFDHVCVNGRCVADDLPSDDTCQTHWDCGGAHVCVYTCTLAECPGSATCCAVCLPPWA